VRVFLLICVGFLGPAVGDLCGQWPGRLRGRISDPENGSPISGALVGVMGSAFTAISDVAGRFEIQGLGPGSHILRVERVGYEATQVPVELRNGRSVSVEISLNPEPFRLDGISMVTERPDRPGWTVTRETIERSGAHTAADALRGLPAVLVREDRPGAGQRVSIRGGSAAGTLVLVDGVPWNDPITGVADLGRLPAAVIERIVVVPGGQTARYGAGARAGVVLVTTRGPESGWMLTSELGSLGRRGVDAEIGGVKGDLRWRAGGTYDRIGGAFDFELPREVGGGRARRANADTRTATARLVASLPLLGGALRSSGSVDEDERGLPGKGFAQSETGRSNHRRLRLSARWQGEAVGGALSTLLHLGSQSAEVRDADPPTGVPFEEHWTFRSAGIRSAWQWGEGAGSLAEWGVSLRAASHRVRSTALSERASSARWDADLTLNGTLTPIRGRGLRVKGALGIHRDPTDAQVRPTHELEVSWNGSGLRGHVAHRSSFRAPSMADQYFREGVAVVANPDLGAEWTPSELEFGLELRRDWGRTVGSVGATVYSGDVRGLVVWMPDFRFVWSPVNIDVRRKGLDAWVRTERRSDIGDFRIEANYGLRHVTYDRPGGTQVSYRPRHVAFGSASFSRGLWRLRFAAEHTGARYPFASAVNALPAFTTLDLRLAREWVLAGRPGSVAIHLRRLADQRDALIFGYPHPGRTVEIAIHLQSRGARVLQ
jgi:iron complex outermembrane receptor protein